ncbi:hypothetical protein BaRGS_00020481 [Batillaria attramentaria]|uniref:Uncharacterized protein n=1 Tax=Batillaria attramentaria TaxID=370345 RepID=A0ABD0KN21_9CAEN
MPPSARKNVHPNAVKSQPSVSRMSTMCRESPDVCSQSGRMRLTGMSEEADPNTLPGLQQDPTDETVPTVPLIESFHDVETLKSQVRRLALGNDEALGSDLEKDTASPSGRESTLSLSSDDTLNCDDSRSGGIDSNDTSLTGDVENHATDSLGAVQSGKTDPVQVNSQSHGGGIKAGLLMSPVLLTEDVPVDVGASNRLSSVLENISLPLLYLPTTRQIVNGDKSPGSVNSASGADAPKEGGEQFSRDGGFTGETFPHECNGSEILSTSQTPVSETPGSMFHTVSSSTSSDFDRLRADPDQVTLNSVESFTSNTLSFDPTARLYTDTSSLSSISTGTDFSVSAVSIGDDYGESKHALCDVEDGTFMDVNLHGRNSYEASKNSSLDSGFEDRGAKPKKRGFSFLSR